MSYYRGDYYRGRGDYYRGDPLLGALAPLAGGLIKKGVSALISRARGGGAAAAAGIAVGAGARVLTQRLTTTGGIASPGPGVPIQIRPSAILPGGQPFISAQQAPKGYHLAKNPDAPGPHGPMWPWVRNRYTNPGNARALRRAIRRQEGFVSLAKRMGMVQGGGRRRILKPRKGRR